MEGVIFGILAFEFIGYMYLMSKYEHYLDHLNELDEIKEELLEANMEIEKLHAKLRRQNVIIDHRVGTY